MNGKRVYSIPVVVLAVVSLCIVTQPKAPAKPPGPPEGEADFDNKGYWHNKNGLKELTANDGLIVWINGLPPYSSPSPYFDAGDEPFDGYFEDGTPVEPAFDNGHGSPIWGAGTWQAEVSQFLVDANAGGDPRERLAQQLLAFIFNTELRLGGSCATVEYPDGTVGTAQALIDEAIDAWQFGTGAEQTDIKVVLDWFNNQDAVRFVPCDP